MKVYQEIELLTDNNKVITWHASSPEEAAQQCANTMRVTIVAWRYPRFELLVGIPKIKE